MFFRDQENFIVKDKLVWEATMRLRWYAPYYAERVTSGSFFPKTSERIGQGSPRLQQLWVGRATAGSQTVLLEEWRDVPIESVTEFKE